VLENPNIGTAAYIITFEDNIEADPDRLEKEPPEIFPDENGRSEVLDGRWKPYAELTKKRDAESNECYSSNSSST